MSKRAALFFDRPEFEGLGLDGLEDTDPKVSLEDQPETNGVTNGAETEDEDVEMQDSASDNNDFEEVKVNDTQPDAWDADSDEERASAKPGTFPSTTAVPKHLSNARGRH